MAQGLSTLAALAEGPVSSTHMMVTVVCNYRPGGFNTDKIPILIK